MRLPMTHKDHREWEKELRAGWTRELEEKDYDSLIKSERYIADYWISKLREELSHQLTTIQEMVEGMKKLDECVLHEELGYHGKDCWDNCMEIKNRNNFCDELLTKLSMRSYKY